MQDLGGVGVGVLSHVYQWNLVHVADGVTKPLNMAPLLAMMAVSVASYTLTCFLLNTVI